MNETPLTTEIAHGCSPHRCCNECQRHLTPHVLTFGPDMTPVPCEEENSAHEYVPTSQWTGLPDFPRWAACRSCPGWRGPIRATWREVEQDYDEHATTPTQPTQDGTP